VAATSRSSTRRRSTRLIRSQIPGLPNASSFTIDNIWDVSDVGQLAHQGRCRQPGVALPEVHVRHGGRIMVFNGYVGATLLPGGQAQGLVTTSTVLSLFGRPTYYAA
jgi:hypothetical protein